MNVVSLPMYDWPEVQGLNDALYVGIREHLLHAGFDAPEHLARLPESMPLWQSPDLLVSQTCGLPYVTHLRETVELLGTPDFDLPGCRDGFYRSAIVVRADDPVSAFSDLAGSRAVVNGYDSQSGCIALHHPVMRLEHNTSFFGEIAVSGSHRASAAAVASSSADVCAIDPVSWQLIQDWDPDTAAQLRVLDWSDSVPALPLITSRLRDAEQVLGLRTALQSAFVDPALKSACSALHLKGLVPLCDVDYDVVESGRQQIAASGLLR